MIISEGIPMTNGEVFALLRRRRDERNAKLQPPFGLQFSSSSSNTSTTQMQTQRGSAPVMTSASANTTLFFPPEALFMQDEQQKGGINSMASTMSMLNARNNALFASPTASHLIVLLTELRALRYLSKYATISGTNRVHQLYGPTSIHCRSRHHNTKIDKGRQENEENGSNNNNKNDNTNSTNKHGNNIISTSPYLEDVEGIDDAAFARQQEALMQIIKRCRPGTVNHVRAVDTVLSLWEMRGRNQELNSSNKVKMILRTLRDRLQASSSCNEEVSDTPMNEKDRQELSSSDRPRLMFAPPSVPLSMFLTEQPSSSSPALTAAVEASSVNRDGGVVMNGSAAALQKEEVKWTTQDLLRLVMARPRDSLDVHRVVDNLEELAGQNEELLNFVEEEIVRAFA
ncbi:hypothetical protein LSM04_008072 [Trypanosoma melophagium]|uniref:uncharacterized protein n=1 Tax=Trypanosoma melophagium TaxID=715481 RepID=UPI00351A0450|nr:hypothetical protein LSM04_008072 [Trypanosoma melophagium]